MRVGIDLDGVLFNFSESLYRYLKDVHPDKAPRYYTEDGMRWNFFEDWGLSLAEFLEHCNAAADARYLFAGPTRPWAKDALEYLAVRGHSLHIVTDRRFGTTPKVSEDITREWLYQHGIPYDSLTFSADKTVVPTDVFIEDKPANYDALWHAGTKCYMVTRPWNQDHPVPDVYRVSNVSEFAIRVGILGTVLTP
jgi:hypothetical protein